MVDQERCAAIGRLFSEERVSISEIGRRLDLDRKTVRRSLRQTTWQPYHRAAAGETLLTAHAEFVRDRDPQVGYSARILYQELRASRGYTGSYETVKRCVAPLREVQLQAERALLRFETPPGEQSQIDWGQATVPFRAGPVVVHVFVLTLGFSRRGFYYACADERLAQFLEAHERTFAHFGGHTREHLYDRPRTSEESYQNYLVEYPRGTFVALAQAAQKKARKEAAARLAQGKPTMREQQRPADERKAPNEATRRNRTRPARPPSAN